jgi:transposase
MISFKILRFADNTDVLIFVIENVHLLCILVHLNVNKTFYIKFNKTVLRSIINP